MGIYNQRLAWWCAIIICLLLIVHNAGYQVNAESEFDSDLTFDSDSSHSKRSIRQHNQSPTNVDSEDEGIKSSPPVEEQHWLSYTVDRIKRSISSLFHNSDNNENQRHKRSPQDDFGGQQETDEDYDDDDRLDNEYDNEIDSNRRNYSSTYNVFDIRNDGDDDEDRFDPYSGSGTTSTRSPPRPNIPVYIRFEIIFVEPYDDRLIDRNSNQFRELADRVKRSVESLYQNVTGTQTATVINVGKHSEDNFKVRVTVDLLSNDNPNAHQIIDILKNNIENNHRVGQMTARPEGFKYSIFEVNNICDVSAYLTCRNGQCVRLDARCNGYNDCDDNSDEEWCEPDVELSRPSIDLDSGFEGSGLDETERTRSSNCRADDVVRCSDGSRDICQDNICDGVRDCDDGGDERNCTIDCATGEFSCDLKRCLPINKRCDGVEDCQDRTDEQECHCNEDQFLCDTSRCISNDKRCDRRYDCNDGSDEANCPLPQDYCGSGRFHCGSGQCIDERQRCDGSRDCNNGADEADCYDLCQQNEFLCDNICRPNDIRCDGFQQCADGNDESNCGGNIRCRSDEFQCESGKCIPSYLRCNGQPDCEDRSDELACPSRCGSDQFTCRDGNCIPIYLQCNSQRDCPDGSDEEECSECRGNQFLCLNGKCINSTLRCNKFNDCSDGSDEHNCPTEPPPYVPEHPVDIYPPQHRCLPGQIECKSSRECIYSSQICDGQVDCVDLSDESNCDGSGNELNLRTYPSSQEIKENIYKPDREVVFQCRDEGPLRARVHWIRPNGLPLPPGSRDHNGRLEIPNIKVEHSGTYICEAIGYPTSTPGAQVSVQLHVDRWIPIPTRPPTACQLNEATCSNGECISKHLVCDGQYDCTDGSDEIRCNPNGCEPNEYRCQNKKCVLKTWRCDSDDDCGDGSDEQDCGTSPPGSLCQYHQFTCHSRNQCIPKSYHCDLERDCVDGSDEVGCAKPIISKPPPPRVVLDVGALFEISCTAVGVPTPEIVWRLNWGHVPAKCRSTSENGVGTLVCPDIQIEDQGAYSCEAINIKGTTFAVPDTILIVNQRTVCPPGYFNSEAHTASECIKCFCFGHTTTCHSADLYIYQFQPPFDTLKLLGVLVNQQTGSVEIRDEPIYRGVNPQLTQVGRNGLHSSLPYGTEVDQPNLLPYFAMPENYHGNQLKSYGGYLRYNVLHTNRGHQTPGPDIILTGNGYTLLHQSRFSPLPYTNHNMSVRFFVGEWVLRSDNGPESLATREEIMMALENIDNLLIKLQYNEGFLNTTITNIEMDSAAAPNSGLGAASYVEECSCPVGYSGNSCERCASGFSLHKSGPWLGQCYKEQRPCPSGTYSDGGECHICPCPLTSPSSQFGRTCSLHPDGDVVCDCPPGYIGRRCESCAPGFSGNPLGGEECRTTDYCNSEGSSTTDVQGQCVCKQYTSGPNCDQCKANTFYLSSKNQFGCIACFCMGITQQCSSSNWYRDEITSLFTSSVNDFALIDPTDQEPPLSENVQLNQENREIYYINFPPSKVYYWSLPSRYLGNKITSYGGYLKYTLRNTPVPGGQSSRNSAADVELVSKNNIRLLFFSNRSQPINTGQAFVVPLFEQYWQRQDGQSADREHLLMTLADLEAINIKATYYTNTREASLSSVSLDIASERNTGSFDRALEVEQCQCPPGYKGLSCEDCDYGYTRSLGGIYLGTCQPCECNGHSNECHPETGECSNCRDFTTGENCEECLPGYEGDPTKGIPCRYRGGPAPSCNCNPSGSISNDCYNGVCTCRLNVEGRSCDQCKKGAFGLNTTNIYGCDLCFCSGIAKECTEGNFYIEQIPYQITNDSKQFSLTDQSMRVRIRDRFEVREAMNEIRYSFLPSSSERLFWSIPSAFTGNKILSYGGRLEFIQRYTQRPYSRYVPDDDIIISGNGVTISWSNPTEQPPNIANKVSVPLHPSANWHRRDQNRETKPASREDILIVLANIDWILIRATQSSDTANAYLSDITLDTAVKQYTTLGRAVGVEVCNCPPGYRGTSCELCAPGYYRDLYFDDSKPLGSCTLCPCRNADGCSLGPDRRVICHCKPGTTGQDCTEYPTPRPLPGPVTPPPPTIEIEIVTPEIEIFEVGSTVRYNCSARSRVAPRTVRIHWTKDNGVLPEYAIDDGKGMLIITNLQVSDSGRYICQADDGYSVATSIVNLNVGQPRPEYPRIVITPNYVDVYERQSAEVRCTADGVPAPTIQLVRNDGQALSPYHSFENGLFRISQIQRSDAGRYECIATNIAGSDSATFQIDVRETVAPIVRVEIQPPSYVGVSDDVVTLRCIAHENIESIRWSKENGQLPYSSRENDGVLVIQRARPEDSGVYVCSVTSYSGTTGVQRASVTIEESDQGKYPVVKVSPERTTITQGSSVQLQCSVSGFPIPTIKWTKVGEQFRPNIEQIGPVLHIRNARVEDRGLYVCVATNNNGIQQASAAVEVTRLEAPILEIHPSERQSVVAETSAILQCRAVAGFPAPTITWTRGLGQPLTPNIEEMSDGILRFTQISPREAGEYICTAVNEAGRGTATATIEVLTLPEVWISPSEETITRNINDFLRLECRGSGTPPPAVVWSKPSIYQSRDDAPAQFQNIAVQEFNRLSKEDEGIYICKGQNTAGVVEKRVRLIVDTLPERGDITGGRSPKGEDATRESGYKNIGPFPKAIDEHFTAPVGTRAELRCSTNDDTQQIQIDWQRPDNSSLPPTAYIRGGTLYIHDVQPSAAGLYKCLGYDRSTNRLVFSLNSYLEVISPPRIMLRPQKQTVHPGDNAFIECIASGEQPITINWSPVNRAFPTSVETRDGYIRFNNIQLNDAGRYRCSARNSAGEADAVAEVLVEENIYKPRITAENRNQTAPLGSTVTLRCRARNPLDTGNIRWFRERDSLSPNATLEGEYLRIDNLQQSDQGRYYCEVPTDDGTSSDYVDLQVLRPSVVDASHSGYSLKITPPSETYFQEGENVDIVCQSNEPGVITTWTKRYDSFANNVQSRGNVLRFRNLRPENAGVYLCEATGRDGAYFEDYILNVQARQAPPRMPVEVRRAPRGSSVQLECQTDLEEPVSYKWSKQGGVIPRNVDVTAKTIQLNDVGMNDASTYICYANNDYGRDLRVPTILVVTGIVPFFNQAPNSYLSLHTIADHYLQFTFEISFKPENGHGLILYNSNNADNKHSDFISLALIHGVPQFSFNLGMSTTTVRADDPVSNREWHTIRIKRDRRNVTMHVDGQGPYTASSKDRLIGIDLVDPLYLGGVPDYNALSRDIGVYNGFVGCISRLKIGHAFVDILREATNKVGITSCETCSESKCENQGACQESLTKEGYTCLCPMGYSGPTCRKLKEESCSPDVCGNGRCIETEDNFECHCPIGLGGKYCEREVTVNEPAFKNDAFISYKSPSAQRRIQISLKMKPKDSSDGILLYASEEEEGYGNFISLAIRDKHLEFSFDSGNGPTIIRHPKEIVPGQWTIISAIKSLNTGRLIVQGSPITGRSHGGHRAFTLNTPLYIGGYDKHRVTINNHVRVTDGFNGCISDVKIPGITSSLLENIYESSNVEDCSDDDVDNNIYSSNNEPDLFDPHRTGCSDNPCQNNGQCYPLSPIDYKCSCEASFTGKNCEIEINLCDQRPCQNGGTCTYNTTGYNCNCPLGFTGNACEQRVELRSDVHFDGNGYLEFSRSLLSHENEDESEVIAMELSTNSSDGLIFWHGQRPSEDGQGQDYIALAIENGYLEFSYDLGSGPAIIQNRALRVNDGEKHIVILTRRGKEGSIEIDHHYVEDGEAQGITSALNCDGNIYLGGTPNISLMSGGRFTQGFNGCIHGFELQNSKSMDLGSKAISGLNVKPCSSAPSSDISNDILTN